MMNISGFNPNRAITAAGHTRTRTMSESPRFNHCLKHSKMAWVQPQFQGRDRNIDDLLMVGMVGACLAFVTLWLCGANPAVPKNSGKFSKKPPAASSSNTHPTAESTVSELQSPLQEFVKERYQEHQKPVPVSGALRQMAIAVDQYSSER